MKNLLNPCMRKGMSLIEVLVSLLILSIIMAGIIIILQVQQSRAISVRSQAILHTDAQVGLSLLKWDVFMAGYAMPSGTVVIQDGDGTGPVPGTDRLTLRGGVLGLESRRGRWNQLLEGVSNSNKVYVRRWDDPDLDFIGGVGGDTVSVADMNTKQRLYTGIRILSRNSATTSRGEPAWELILSSGIRASMGSFLFMEDINTYQNGVTFEVQQVNRGGVIVKNLVRQYAGRNEILLENIEDFQVQYGIDINFNGIIEASEWRNSFAAFAGLNYLTNPDTLKSLRFMIGLALVNTTDRPIPNYTYPAAMINLYNHNYALTNYDRMFRRVIMFEEIMPRNIKI